MRTAPKSAVRTRQIRPSFWDNETLIEMGSAARLLFAGLWCLADREGRIEDNPCRIRRKLGMDNENVRELLDMLADGADPFIRRYTSQGIAVIEVLNLTRHQNIHPDEAASRLPEIQLDYAGSREITTNLPLGSSASSGPSATSAPSVGDARVPARRSRPLTSLPPDLVAAADELPNIDTLNGPTVKQLTMLVSKARGCDTTLKAACQRLGIATLSGIHVDELLRDLKPQASGSPKHAVFDANKAALNEALRRQNERDHGNGGGNGGSLRGADDHLKIGAVHGRDGGTDAGRIRVCDEEGIEDAEVVPEASGDYSDPQ